MNLRELVNFLEGLHENNNRAWFAMNKPAYDILRAEFTQLVAQLIEGAARFDPPVAGQDPKKAQFRINRDIRFSKDKSPYKTHFSAVIAPGGKKDPGSHYYFHIDHRGTLLVAGGCYMPPADVLGRIRRHIVAQPQSFAKLLRARGMWRHFGAFAEEGRLARPPKGFSADSPHIEFIRQKSFIVWTEVPVRGMDPAALRAHILSGFKASLPLIRWLREAVG
ncbi:MAG: DUF2461 domain-containing protein [Burkholderiales bacterium]|nr:DUF2461 domain-containing protein [Burkholderiales bacterium]